VIRTDVRGPGLLDDHAFLLDALLERLQAGWRDADLDWARTLAEALLRDFEDADNGGFFFTAHAHEPLPQRPKPWFDDATPSGNAVAARALLRLGHLLGEPRWLDAAERTLRAGIGAVREAPHGACTLIRTLHEYLHPPQVVVLRATALESAHWETALHEARATEAQIYVLPPDATSLADKTHGPGGRAYVCIGMQCRAAISAPDGLRQAMSGSKSDPG
jgi:uncharacterized protein YyaL (SSP411 family)